jgi:class 3 adenylate cyclase/tetratricopeptide (TPR) repeat protein
LHRICVSCRAENRPDACFCAECGAGFEQQPGAAAAASPDPLAGQLKHVTVLFADVCGSTQLISGMDPEEARHALAPVINVICDAMERHGGLVNRKMGDGVMVLFGAPNAAEDHATRACFAILAALDDVRHMGAKGLPIRAGLCSGPIILYRTGRDDDDYDVAGVTAHIAARLEQLAEPGCVLLAPQTASQVVGIAELESMGDVALKGVAEPLSLSRLLGAVDRSSWDLRSGRSALSPFVGRSEEIGQLKHAFGRAAGGRPQSVALVGDAGIGKSRLGHEFLRELPKDEWRVVRIETTPRTLAIPFFFVTALLQQLLGCLPEDTPDERAARLSSAVVSLDFDTRLDTAPLLVHLDTGFGEPEGFDPVRRRQQLLASLRPMVTRYAELHPLVLMVEDYQWLDTSSVELLEDLLDGMESVKLLFLLTTRPERRPGWPLLGTTEGEDGQRFEIDLGRLSASQSERLLRELIGESDALAPLRTSIISRADGTPLFLEEFARSLHETGALTKETPPKDIVIPVSVQAILAARIDRQLPQHRRILQVAAVIGNDVPRSLLEAVSDADAPVLAKALDALLIARFLTESMSISEIMYSFTHALTHAVAYDMLLRSDRRLLHGRVLRLLEARGAEYRDSAVDQLTHHAVCAEAWPEAARYALAAGQRASRRTALTEAKAYLETAIAALAHQPADVTTLTMGIDARLGLRGVGMNDGSGRRESLQKYLAEADHLAELAGDRLSMARVTVSRGAILSHWGDLSGAIDVSRTALSRMISLGDTVGIVGAAFALAQAHWYSGNLSEARDLLLEHLQYARSEAGQKRGEATFVLPAAAFFCYLARVQGELGEVEAGFEALREARTVAHRHGHSFDQTLVHINEGSLLLMAGQSGQAIDVLERALVVVRANSFDWHMPMIACVLGGAYINGGRTAKALQLLQEGVVVADKSRHVGKRMLCNPPLIRVLATMGAAEELASDTLRQAAAGGFRPVAAQTYIAIGHRRIALGDLIGARAAAQRAVELAREIGMVHEAEEAITLLHCCQNGGVGRNHERGPRDRGGRQSPDSRVPPDAAGRRGWTRSRR